MFIQQLYTSCLAQAAYYIESNGEAAIIDPLRDYEAYVAMANERGAKIKYIFETHFHADFVSGHLDLANLSQYLFAFDDAYGDRAGIGRDSKSAWKVFDDFFVVMAGDPPRSGHPYALIFQDIWGRVALPMTAGQRSRHRK